MPTCSYFFYCRSVSWWRRLKPSASYFKNWASRGWWARCLQVSRWGLHIGFETGLLPPVVFSMMVVMALVTTVMTVPLLRRTYLATIFPAVILSPEPNVVHTLLE